MQNVSSWWTTSRTSSLWLRIISPNQGSALRQPAMERTPSSRPGKEHPSLIVLDLMLPGMSGFDVLEELRRDDAYE